MSSPLAVLVLAAGLGKRTKVSLPKVLLPLCGRNLLGTVLDEVQALSPAKTVVVLHHGRDRVQKALADRPGLPLVDVPLVDQDAKPLRFADYKGRAFALTFIYTRCPLPEFCPRTMKGFSALDEAIEAEPALRDRTRLLSISFDTEFDKPEVLKAFGSAYVTDRGQGPFARWRLASGTAADIERLATFLGLVFYKEDGSFTHSMITVIVGPDGKIVRELDGPEWEVADALDALREALGVKKPQASAAASPGAAR